MKYLLLIIVLVLVWRHWLQRGNARSQTPPASREKPVEKMLGCATCQVLLPESDAIIDGGEAFCCEAHRAQARRR